MSVHVCVLSLLRMSRGLSDAVGVLAQFSLLNSRTGALQPVQRRLLPAIPSSRGQQVGGQFETQISVFVLTITYTLPENRRQLLCHHPPSSLLLLTYTAPRKTTIQLGGDYQ